MRRAGWIILGMLVLSLLARAGEAWELEVFETTLDNGLKVLLLEDHKAPVVTFHIWYRVGSRNEEFGRTGLAHLMEHMMFKGSANIGGQEFSQIIKRNGGRDNAFTSQDYTGYFVTLASDRIEIPLKLEPDRMANLLMDPAEVTRERSVVMEERRLRTEDDPTSALWEEVQAAAFKAHPYGNPVIGWMEDIRQLKREDLLSFYKTYYIPNNAVVVVVGNFERAKLLPKIEEAFGSIPRRPDPPAVRSIEPLQDGGRRVVLLRQDAQLPSIIVAFHVPNLRDADSYALDVLELILSGGKSAQLYQHLVYEKELALSAGAHYTRVSADPDLFSLYCTLAPGKTVEEMESALFAEIEQLQTGLVSARELQKAKNQIEASFIFSKDSVFSLAHQLASNEMVAGWRSLNAYLPGIRAVTREDIQRVARKYLTAENRTVGILVPGQPSRSQQSAVSDQPQSGATQQ